MGQTTVKHIVDIVAGILQDESETESERLWSEQDLVDYYNIVATNIVRLKPEANPVTQSVKLASGVRHYIPSGGMALIRVVMNMGTDGETLGDAVTPSLVNVIELFDTSWSQATAASAINHYMQDPKDSTLWYSYPPSDGTGYVLMEFSKMPNKISWDEDGDWESAHVGIQDGFEQAIIEGMLEMAYRKDSDIPGNVARAASHKANYLQELAS